MNVSPWTSPGTVSQSTMQTRVWANPSNATATDGAWASIEMLAGSSHRALQASGYTFDVPEDAVLLGIEVKLRRSLIISAAESDYDQHDNIVRVNNGVATGQNKATSTPYPKLIDPSGAPVVASDYDANAFERTYGGASDLWTLPRVLVANFNPLLTFQPAQPVNKDTAFAFLGMDSMLLRIYWTPADPDVRIV